MVSFETGFIHDSVPEKLYYFNYYQTFNDSIKKHIYSLDSIFQGWDSSIVKGYMLDEFYHKLVYYQSLNMDTLFLDYYEKDSLRKSQSSYVFIDTLRINVSDSSFLISKYEIPNPPCDGDLTLFFNNKIGFIEKYNKGWGARTTVHQHGKFKDVLSLLSNLKNNRVYYYKVIPPADIIEVLMPVVEEVEIEEEF